MNDEYFMGKALELARDALAEGEFPVGCVMVCRDEILVTGARQGTAADGNNAVDHAEMVALRNLIELEQAVEPGDITVYCTMEPCLMCYAALMLSGVGKIVYAYEDVMGGGCACERSRLTPLYKNSPIKIVASVLRSESLKLFQAFFSDPANRYWENSLLAEYTLAQ